MKTIKLPRGTWQYDPNRPLGPKGGFGTVYAGFSENMGNVAVKQIDLEAHREIRIADELLNHELRHIIPIFDSGQDADTGGNFIVMAWAEKSLQDELNEKKQLTEQEVVSILHEIASGLTEVPKLVHRDLKPGNILLHSGVWKIADFGIAKFVEESTSLRTLNDCLSPYFAAPEQWNLEQPTNAIDIYALGCIAYTLTTGTYLFIGSTEDLKNQHLLKEPPLSNIKNERLRTLIGMMVRKQPEVRPTAQRVIALLEQIKTEDYKNVPVGFSALSNAAALISEKNAKEEAELLQKKKEQENRKRIAIGAQKILSVTINNLFNSIQRFAPNAIRGSKHGSQQEITLGNAYLFVDYDKFPLIPAGAFSRSGWDVITGALIKVIQKGNNPYERSANLWFTNLGKDQELRWWEVTYMVMFTTHPKYEPYAVENLSDADFAASPGMSKINFGAKPKIIDDEYMDEFCNRWADLLAKAAKGELSYPRTLPLD